MSTIQTTNMAAEDGEVAATVENSDAYRDAFAPIEIGSEKHNALIRFYEAKEANEAIFRGMAERIRTVDQPHTLGELYGQAFAIRLGFPSTDAPTWATSHDDPGSGGDGNPTRLWIREISDSHQVSTRLVQDAAFNVHEGRYEADPVMLSVDINGNPAGEFRTPAEARTVAEAILAAADDFERVVPEVSD